MNYKANVTLYEYNYQQGLTLTNLNASYFGKNYDPDVFWLQSYVPCIFLTVFLGFFAELFRFLKWQIAISRRVSHNSLQLMLNKVSASGSNPFNYNEEKSHNKLAGVKEEDKRQ